MAETQQRTPNWNDHPAISLLGVRTSKYSPVILSKPEVAASPRSSERTGHEWVALGRPDSAFRSRCPRCGVVRELVPHEEGKVVSYTIYGELLAHGELGHVQAPECSASSRSQSPPEWDVLGI